MVIAQCPPEELTFVFTDIEGSTRLWESAPQGMAAALERHSSIVEQAVVRNGGDFVRRRGEGDSTFSVFRDPLDAVRAVCRLQAELDREPWPSDALIRVRAALRTGSGLLTHGDYNSSDVNRCARLRSLASGGQTLVCQVTASRVLDRLPDGMSLECLGSHRLKDLQRAERIYELRHPELPTGFPPLRTLDTLPTNLPTQLTSFIGRQRELDEVCDLLRRHRLVTFTGPGGTGKTRLALQAAAEALDERTDGVWLALLGPLDNPRLVASAVASAVGIAQSPALSVEDVLERELRSSDALLVLDNCEHLLHACGDLVEHLLLSCPRLRVLATSRAALGISGEVIYNVPSLDVPHADDHSAAAVLNSSAGRLFVERVSSFRAGFEVTHERAAVIGGICRRLDGIPLAIELASAKIRVMTVPEIAGRLDDCVRLLTGGRRSPLQRHETLGALIDWSYDLLSDAEKALMRRLALFAGGWDMAAAEGVCAGDGIEADQIVELMTGLVHQSLVIHEDHEERSRFRMLEIVRQYGLRKLAEHHEVHAWTRRHHDYFCTFVCTNSSNLVGPEEPAWLRRFDDDHDNMRAALRSLAEDPSGIENGLLMAAALWRFWQSRGYFSEGHACVAEMLQRPGAEARTKGRGAALTTLGIMYHARSDFRAAVPVLEESLSIREELGDTIGMAKTLNGMGVIANEEGRNEDAEAFYVRSAGLHRRAGNPDGEARATANLANVRCAQGDFVRGRQLYEEALAVFRHTGNGTMAAMTLHNLSNAHAELGNLDEALACIRQALTERRALGDVVGTASSTADLARLLVCQGQVEEAQGLMLEALRTQNEMGCPREVANTLEALSSACLSTERYERAARLCGAASRIREDIGYPRVGCFAARYEAGLSRLVDALGFEALGVSIALGRAMSDDAVVAYALDPERTA
jgi:predicted ATPase/class 3 adenylate cyclase